jgi:hypothetical protein
MNHPACSAADLESDAKGVGPAIVLCVFHLIAGVAVAFVSIGALALFGVFR